MFSGFWDWKENKEGIGEKNEENFQREKDFVNHMGNIQTTDNPNPNKGNEKESKIERVKRMQKAYCINNDPKSDSLNPKSNPNPYPNPNESIPLKPVTLDQSTSNQSHIMRSKVKNVTDLDMVTISKYFSLNDESHPGTPIQNNPNPNHNPNPYSNPHSYTNHNSNHISNPNTNPNYANRNRTPKIKMKPPLECEKFKAPGGLYSHGGSSQLPYNFDPSIVCQDIIQVDDQEFDFPYPYYKYSPTNCNHDPNHNPARSPTPKVRQFFSPNPNSKQLLSPSNSCKNEFKSNTPSREGYRHSKNPAEYLENTDLRNADLYDRNIETPNYGGGVDSILDWTRALDADDY
jgi:hypothetical protein